MTATHYNTNRRILVIDDNTSIHEDFRKILAAEGGTKALDEDEAILFGGTETSLQEEQFELDSAYQGQEALAMVQKATRAGRPYAMAFVDVRMPPGWDGIETVAHLWPVDPNLQIVICTAYSDYSWDEMITKLGLNDRLLILKKPFDNVEVRQHAVALTEKWNLARKARLKLYEVESIVETRTRDLESARAQLSTARDEAEAASRAKSDFLANMSHEIRTPMTAILGFAETLLDPELDAGERLDAARTIQRNGDYLLAIINDILDISKIEAGKMEIERIACSPCRLIAEVADLVKVRAESCGLAFNVEYLGNIPETIQTDPTRLRQILINLIGNAIKFTKTGGVRLITRFVQREETEHMMQFDVLDTGIGMTAEQAAKLFQPFQQADTSTTRQFGGTGLGLHISKRLAKMLGGDIVVVGTQQGVGTRFRVTIATGPLDGVKMIDGGLTATSQTAEKPEEPARQVDLNGCRVLLAEDGPDNQRLISFHLKKAGADVTAVENGKIAVDAALAVQDQDKPFDVILMDMQMPVMSGYEATGLLRREGYTSPIIALTAHAMTGDREKCIEAGCDDYASKPIDRGALIAQVARWAQKSRGLQPARCCGVG